MMKVKVHEIAKQALDFQKGTFVCWWDAMSVLQDQAASAVDKMLTQTSLMPDEGRRAVSNWVGTCKHESDRYKVYMEESFSVMEKHLSGKTEDASAGPDTTAGDAKQADPAIKSEAAVEKE